MMKSLREPGKERCAKVLPIEHIHVDNVVACVKDCIEQVGLSSDDGGFRVSVACRLALPVQTYPGRKSR